MWQVLSIHSGTSPNWNGVMDVKRFQIQKPTGSGSEYSAIMLALVDANYKFQCVDVGVQGRASDAGVWNRCTQRGSIEQMELNIPPPSTLPFTDVQSPYVIIGGDAFPLKTYMMNS